MATIFSADWDAYFGRIPLPANPVRPTPSDPAPVYRAWYTPQQAAPAASFATRQPHPQAATPTIPPPPTRPTSQQPISPEPPPSRRFISPEPPRRPLELAWLTWQLSEALREKAKDGLRHTLHWRARQCGPLPPPQRPIERSRFGLRGEPLVPESTPTVRDLLYTELRESVRTLEASLSWSERNYRLAMHSTRLGQLCRELEQRAADDVLEIIRTGLALLWE